MELSSCAKICSRCCFCLSSPFTISSNDASGLAFSSCEMITPVLASLANVASQQGQMMVNRDMSAIELPSCEAGSITLRGLVLVLRGFWVLVFSALDLGVEETR